MEARGRRVSARGIRVQTLSAAAGAILLGCEAPPAPPETIAPEDAILAIRNADIRAYVAALAHDSMRGRETPSPELERAARYVARRLQESGLQPGAGAEYLQRFPFSLGTEGVNVVGVLQGSDRRLRAEYVVLSAHLDHLGVGIPLGRDSIYNGADDNASGVAVLLELAEAFGRLRPAPARSMAFMAFGGEEHGLWGSRYWVDHPTLPVERAVAVLNMDMLGRNFRDTLAVIGEPASQLAPLAQRVAAARGEHSLRLLRDPWPEQGLFGRSDQYHFARKGVPALLFTSGLHEDYHSPSDEAGRLDYEKTTRVARLLFHIGLEIANAPALPE